LRYGSLRASPSLNLTATPSFFAIERALDQVVRAVKPLGAIPPAPKFQGMSALAAAEIEDLIIGLEAQEPDDPVDLARGDPGIFDNIAISLEVEVVEDTPPPLRLHVVLQIRDGAKRPPLLAFAPAPAIGGFIGVCFAVHAWSASPGFFSGIGPVSSRFTKENGFGLHTWMVIRSDSIDKSVVP